MNRWFSKPMFRNFIALQRLLLCFLAASIFAAPSFAQNWPQWRGPHFNGSADEQNLPTDWSKTNNVAWATPLPGQSGSTPIVWGDSVFVSSPDADKNLNLLCINRIDGKIRWKKQVAAGDRTIGRNNMASPSPVTDGKSVFVLFGTGALAAFDFEGKELWHRNICDDYGKFSIMWLYGSSPLLWNDRLYVQVLQREPVPSQYSHATDDKPHRESFLLCIDPKTGKDLWRHVRPTDALDESQESYATPIPNATASGTELLIIGGDYLTAHDATDGKELWRHGIFGEKRDQWWRIVPSPVVAEGMVIVCAPKKEPVFGIRDGGKGSLPDSAIAWKLAEFPSDCVTPLYYKGRLFVLDGDHQVMSCLEPKTGRKIWQGNLGVRDIFRASPNGSDGKIYCLSEAGTAVVLDAGEEFKILSTIKMGESPCRSSIAIARGQLFIRTAQNLYCVGKK